MSPLKSILLSTIIAFSVNNIHGQVSDGSDRAEFEAYNNFDFIAGNKVIFYDDFSKGLSKWKITEYDQSDEFEAVGIKKISTDSTSWFKIPRRGVFYPTSVKGLPESFTIEFDMWADMETMSEMESGIILSIVANKVIKEDYSTAFDENSQIQIDIHPSQELLYCIATKENGSDERILEKKQINNGWVKNKIHRISISRNKTHIKVFVNEKKFIDLPNGLPKKDSYTLVMAANMWGDGISISNFRLAEGMAAPPNMNVDGKFVTTALYFNVNSDVIKPESWAALNQAAAAIKSTSHKVMIVGHTDSDGSDEHNLLLSKKRSMSIKNALISQFNIEANKLQTDGKGESLPIDVNTTAEGKANNRRVEFIVIK